MSDARSTSEHLELFSQVTPVSADVSKRIPDAAAPDAIPSPRKPSDDETSDAATAHPSEWSWSRPYLSSEPAAGTYEAKWADTVEPQYSREQLKVLKDEVWLPIPVTDGYEASSWGQIRSLDRYVPGFPGTMRFARGRVLALDWDPLGYARIRIKGFKSQQLVSRLVAMTFHGIPEDHYVAVVRHIDGNPSNNRADNLFWGTQEENVHDTMRHGRHWTFHVTHCPYGHPLEHPNLVVSILKKRGARACRACNSARVAIWMLEKKGRPAPSMQELSDIKFAKFWAEKPKAS